MIPLLWLLLANQWAAAFAGHMNMNMPAQPATEVGMMAMTGMMHVTDQQTNCESAQQHPCHGVHQQGAPASHSDHCNSASACNLCHAPPAMLLTTLAPEAPTSTASHHWRAIFYASIVMAGLDRPPAPVLA